MSNAWHDLKNTKEQIEQSFDAVIEVPKGSKIKYELDKETGLLRVSRILHSSVVYPIAYGFIPQTYCEDEDPLDILILSSEIIGPLSIVSARAIGILHLEDDGKRDDKIIAVHINDPTWVEYTDISQLPKHTILELKQFFQTYKMLENRQVKVEEFGNAKEAIEVIKKSLDLYHITFL